MIDIDDKRRELIAKRTVHGAETPIGFRCSNAVEQLQGLRTLQDNYDTAINEIADLEFAAIL